MISRLAKLQRGERELSASCGTPHKLPVVIPEAVVAAGELTRTELVVLRVVEGGEILRALAKDFVINLIELIFLGLNVFLGHSVILPFYCSHVGIFAFQRW